MFTKLLEFHKDERGGVGDISQETGDSIESVEGSVNLNTTINTEESKSFEIPEAYKNKPYLKDVKSAEDFFKKLDGAQSLIGKKVLFPTENSSEEEIKNFNLAAGMPEKAEDYVFEKLGETERIPEFDSKVKEIFHKYGVPAKAATGIAKEYESFINELEAQQASKADAEFEEMGKKIFGDKQDYVLASAKQLLQENIPKEFSEEFSKLSNKELTMFAGVLNNIREKYINEDSLTPTNGSLSGGDRKSLQDALYKLMDERDRVGAFAPNYGELSSQITDICRQIAKYDESK